MAQNRKPRTIELARGLSMPLDAATETFGIFAVKGRGKALALSTPVPTPTGWTTMGDITVGDQVFDETGHPCTVTAVHPVRYDRPCYRVRFSDGAEIIADGEHLWLTEDAASRRADSRAGATRRHGGRPQYRRRNVPTLRTTEQIAATLRYGPYGHANHAVAVSGALDLPIAGLPIDPYVLGVWLGDGTSVNEMVPTADQEVLDHITARGSRVVGSQGNNGGRAGVSHRVHEGPDGVDLSIHLRRLGLLGNKHVPGVYLRAAATQRLDLLRGLMDSAGTVKSGRAIFCSTRPELADAVHEIVVSLGWQAHRTKRTARHNGVEHGTTHVVSFRPVGHQPFRLVRKAARLPLGKAQETRHRRRMIVAVEPVETVPVRCFAVDSPSRLYLAGRDMVPTHNTFTSAVLTEQLLDAGVPVVVIDPTGVHWGLRSSADGKKPGFPITIIGGDHADVPLEETAGTLLAELVAEKRVPLLLDLSHLRKNAMRRFLTDFMSTLFLKNRHPLHVIADECDMYVPQRTFSGIEHLLGAMEDVVRRGRVRGLGITLISQRPAAVHTSVRSQVGTLILLGMTGTHDIKAVDEWVNLHADPEIAKRVKASLPSLPVGEAWIWSPQWLGILERVKVNRRTTFDSSATPKVGESLIPPAKWATVDAAALSAEIAATVERARENDPKALRAAITKLRARIAELEAAQPVAPEPVTVEVTVPTPVIDAEAVGKLDANLVDVAAAIKALQADLQHGLELVQKAGRTRTPRPAAAHPAPRRTHTPRPAPAVRPVMDQAAADVTLSRAERKVLAALAEHPTRTRTKRQVALLTGYASKGGGFNNAISKLRTRGYVTGGNDLTVTAEGVTALGAYEPPPHGEELLGYWCAHPQLGKASRVILQTLVAQYPQSITRARVAEETGYEATGGGFNNALSKLRTLELVTDEELDGAKALRASDDLFG